MITFIPDESSTTPQSYRSCFFFVLVISSLVLLSLVGMGEIYNVGEGREGVVIEEIFDSGEYILPLRNGEIVPSKPILFHWVGAALAKLLGRDTEMDVFALRLPSALAGIGSVLLTFYITTLFANPQSGVLAALLLLSTYGFIATSQEGRVDSLFNFFVTLSLAAWITGFVRYRAEGIAHIPARYYRCAALACGLAALTKGPVGLIYVGLIMTTIALFHGGIRSVISLVRPEWVWALLIPVPWYLLAINAGGDDFIGRQFIYENLRRFTGGAGISKRVWWFYFPHLIQHCGPWSIVFFTMLFRKGRDLFLKDPTLPLLGIRVGVLWFCILFCFLNTSAGKHPSYLAPTLPAICLATALWLTHYVRWPAQSRVFAVMSMTIAVIAVSCAPLFVGLAQLNLLSHPRLARTVASIPDALAHSEGLFWGTHCVVSGMIVYHLMCARGRVNLLNRLGPVVVLSLLLLLGVDSHLARAIRGVTHSYATVGRTLRELVPHDQTLHWVLRTGEDERLGVGREDSFDGLFFYFRRHVKRLDDTKVWNTPGFYVARRAWIDAQSEEWRNRVREIFTGGKLADEPHQKIVYFELL